MIEKDKIKYIVILLVFLLSAWILTRQFGVGKNISEDAGQEEKKERSFSRISFFHASPVRASLSIPAEWEGKYRVKEIADKISFYYIGDANGEILLFSVNSKKNGSAGAGEGEVQIAKKDDLLFTYELSTVGSDKVLDKNAYESMKRDVPEIISSFKMF